jgi:hypothetical protein
MKLSAASRDFVTAGRCPGVRLPCGGAEEVRGLARLPLGTASKEIIDLVPLPRTWFSRGQAGRLKTLPALVCERR